ncbi:28S ribosomal protein S7, mitochondrial-like [Haliotis rubra]|uniref:28S ribosomal protein S7, mitochondrial-like n=1 Tax=Haliotis rubra TaxID=36100 RepID=UPI001EE51955|nr:28S ribosomal protein S7, mitochondrial-like [Haliotis rubra]
MAAYRSSHVLKLCSSVSRLHQPLLSHARTAIYSTNYQEPTFKKKDLEEPLPDSDPRRFQPIKAAFIEQTSSVYYDETVQKFIRQMMKSGNRARVQQIMDNMLENLKRIQVEKYHKTEDLQEKESIECNPLTIFHTAVQNCEPILILTKVQRGGVMYQVPIPCKDSYKRYKAMRWLIDSCRDKERKMPMEQKLARELLDAYRGEGRSIRKKQDLHRQCEANKAYSHYRW